MKGIVLAGGSGSRLLPLTHGISKHLLPVYDKPMVYYPLSVLMLAGIRDILLIASPDDLPLYQRTLGAGERFGIDLAYAAQVRPEGIAQAFLIGESFIDNSPVALVLGDNIFYGQGFSPRLKSAASRHSGATLFAYQVQALDRFGCIELDSAGRPLSLEEKPSSPKNARSSFAVTGLYFYDSQIVQIARQVQPSARGELEITSVNNVYLQRKELSVEVLGRGYTWFDTGTHDSLLEASMFVKTIQSHQGFKVACLEEIAYDLGYITCDQLQAAARRYQNDYGSYLERVASVGKR